MENTRSRELGEFPRNNLHKNSLKKCWSEHWFRHQIFHFLGGTRIHLPLFLPSVDSDFDFTSSHPGPAFFAASLKLASLLGSNPWPFLLSWVVSEIRRSTAISTLNHIEIYISIRLKVYPCRLWDWIHWIHPNDVSFTINIFDMIWQFSLVTFDLLSSHDACYHHHWKLFSTHTGSLQTYLHCSFQTLSSNKFTRYGSLHLIYCIYIYTYYISDIISKTYQRSWWKQQKIKTTLIWLTANSMVFQFPVALRPAPMVAPKGGWTIAPPGAQCPPSKATFCLPSFSVDGRNHLIGFFSSMFCSESIISFENGILINDGPSMM